MQTKLTSVERYGHRAGESPDAIKQRATGFVARYIQRGGRLVIGFAGNKSGQMILTVAVAVGREYFRSPSLDLLAAGLGALTATRFLVAWTKYRRLGGSIAIEPAEVQAWEKTGESGLSSGDWTGSDDDWQP